MHAGEQGAMPSFNGHNLAWPVKKARNWMLDGGGGEPLEVSRHVCSPWFPWAAVNDS